jgi:hypothetical protein
MEFRESLIKHFNFSESDWQETIARFRSETLPQKTLFLEKGKVAVRITLIQSWLMRSFFYNDNADDITTHFFMVPEPDIPEEERYPPGRSELDFEL